jgi:membrane associated rhomboid family serine protease
MAIYNQKLIKALVFCNIVAFLLSIALTGTQFNFFWMGLISPNIDQLIDMKWIVKLESFHPLSLISSLFLHIGIVHLIVNLILIIYLGLINISPGRFLVVYIASGVIGNLCAIFTDERGVLGASGAVMGVLGYEIIYGLKNNIDKSSIKELFNIVLLTIIPGLLLSCVSDGAYIGVD